MRMREEVFGGDGIPAQIAPEPYRPYYEEEFAGKYAAYDRGKAEQLLEQMGICFQDSQDEIRCSFIQPGYKPAVHQKGLPHAGDRSDDPQIFRLKTINFFLEIFMERYGIKKHLNIRRTGTESGSFCSLRASAHMRMYG